MTCKEKTTDMDELMESFKAEDQVKGASSAEPDTVTTLGHTYLFAELNTFCKLCHSGCPLLVLDDAGGNMVT
jgi:hypothetical protein